LHNLLAAIFVCFGKAVLALFSAGKTTGVVVDIGASGSLISPVYEGTYPPRDVHPRALALDATTTTTDRPDIY
jgi:actin-related protein